MKRSLLMISAAVVIFALAQDSAGQTSISGKVVEVIDGRTFVLGTPAC
jgi:hypothetical protein